MRLLHLAPVHRRSANGPGVASRHESVREAAAKSYIDVVGCRRAKPVILRMPIAYQRILLEAVSWTVEDAVADWVFDQLRRLGDQALRAEIEAVAAERRLE